MTNQARGKQSFPTNITRKDSKTTQAVLARKLKWLRESSGLTQEQTIRAGFKKAWQERDYATIIAVARKIPDNVLQEDPKLLMWYDQAVTRTGEQA